MDNIKHEIKIEHCNNIERCDIAITVGNLNIKYAINGTGKSTIAKALKLTSEGKSLDSLRPFSFLARNEKVLSPTVTNFAFNNVLVFDNEYLKQFIFQKTDMLKDAFEVFIYSREYDEMKSKIDVELQNIKTLARDNAGFVKIRKILNDLVNIIVINKDGQTLSRKSTGAKSVIDEGKGALFNPPDSLSVFKPFFDDPISVDWAAWKLKGINSYCEKGLCPFCAEIENEEKKSFHQAFKESFDEKSIQFSHKLFDYLTQIKEYINDNMYTNLLEMLKIGTDRKTLEMLLAKLSIESSYLYDKLESLAAFDGYSIDQSKLQEIEKIFIEMKVNESNLDYFNTTSFIAEIKILNNQIDILVSAIGRLKGEIAKFRRYIKNQVRDRKQDINDFLEAAGYNYLFDIVVDGDNVAHAILQYKIDNITSFIVNSPDQNLSWGEKNAFALILFMFDALSKEAKLIVLDDPISSFDSNKKYAIINRLFRSSKNETSFYKKTVLLLTHDFEPVIDYVQLDNVKFALADYLTNLDGVIRESQITKKNHDMYSMVVLLKELSSDVLNQIPVRIGCLRKYIEHTNKDPLSNLAYHVLSSLTHGREYPTRDKEGQVKLSSCEFQAAQDEITKYIDGFDYDLALEAMKPNSLLTMYLNESNHFFRLLILRAYTERDQKARNRIKMQDEILRKFVDETFHIENDYLYMLDVRKFNIVPPFYIKKANKFVENERVYLSKTTVELPVYKKNDYFELFEDNRTVRFIDMPASAGEGIELFDGAGVDDIVAIDDKCSFAVKIKGNSMEPGIPDGSIVFVRECDKIDNYRIGIFSFRGNALCKEIVQLSDRISLVSLNEEYDTIYVTDENDEFRIFGEVTGIVLPELK